MLITIIVTAILSALHGYGRVNKVIPTLIMMVYCTVALYVGGAGQYSGAGLIIGYLWRIVTRSGRQAHAELQAMDTRIKRTMHERVRMVGIAHWCNPFGFLLGYVIDKWLNYDKIPYSTQFFDTRRYVEIASGALPQAAFVIVCMWGVLCL